jgi:hypothetical protein
LSPQGWRSSILPKEGNMCGTLTGGGEGSSSLPRDLSYCPPKTQVLDRPHFTDAETKAQQGHVPAGCTGLCGQQAGIPNLGLPDPNASSPAHCPCLGTDWRDFAAGESRRQEAPTSVCGDAAGILATRSGEGQGRGLQEGSLRPRVRPGPRAPSPRCALTLRWASGGAGVSGPEGAQQRAQRRGPSATAPASAAHPAAGQPGAARGCVRPAA